jgi:hypothetical protein
MVKSLKFIAAVCFLIFSLQSLSAQTIFEKWPEIKSFHEVMSQTYHPSEEGDLHPIKTRIGEMTAKAAALQTSTPVEFNTPEILASEKKLYSDSQALQKLIAEKASDATITSALEGLHDEFHKIIGLCSDGSGH